MAQYIFVKNRQAIQSATTLHELEQVCQLLTPAAIEGKSQNTVSAWPGVANAFYAIQNSEAVAQPEQGALVIGSMQQSDSNNSGVCDSEADGSYAVIKNSADEIAFFSDQFGSRTLWYYLDEQRLIVSTSQRAVVALKGSFQLNQKVLAWYLSSGCQGPFLSWDQDIQQVLPHLEYRLNVADWRFTTQPKPGMQLPPSGTTKMSDYLDLYQRRVTDSIKHIVNQYPDGQVLMPLSGGLDSRSLLALSKHAGLEHKLTLVNWGAPQQKGVFDDKVAAHRVAKFYGKPLLDIHLPAEIDAYDQILDRYTQEGEGRLDQFNAFIDGFKAWEDLFLQGYRALVRGDVDVTEGLDLNDMRVRGHIGVVPFTDYSNISEYPLGKFIKLQSNYDISRLENESIIRRRDRLFTSWCIPTRVSPYSAQISAYIENKAPMLNWSLFKLYMGLSDKDKGNKLHIQKTWEKYDKSGVSRYAVGSLNSLDSIFDNPRGQQYLLDKLAASNKKDLFSTELIASIRGKLTAQQHQASHAAAAPAPSKFKPVLTAAHAFITDNLPLMIKGYLQTKRANTISATTLAYRIVLAEKAITLYESDAQLIKGHA